MPRICFVVNPTAGHGRALKTWKRVEALMNGMGIEYGVRFTERPRQGEELARAAARDGYDRVIALGGDGTLNEVTNGLVGTQAALGIIPTGTGNDWVRTVGIPRDCEKAIRVVTEGRIMKSDVGLAVGYRYFLNIAGIGFDAEVSRRVNDYGPVLKMIGGTLPSLLGIVGTLTHFRGAHVRVQVDDQVVESEKLLLMAVGMARYYGGGMKILPNAQIDNGLFEVAWAENLSIPELFGLLGKVYKGEHTTHPKVRFARASRLTATASSPVAFHLDGDVVGNLPVTFEIQPKALDVVVP